ncbi:hypothetical protein [Nitrosovibrio sp. Nv6]|uniref:hypothetical protein n=1 Tax=Nitrosovibrio sp. Nv6 TaxID=1855340 RepID=UPI00115FBCB7|nr:hypothetical protein [Nitrosovibrio sp. Nv6]
MRYSENVNAPRPETDANMRGATCVICYVDRFAEKYVYYPFRRGKIISIVREQGRVFYHVELESHCHSQSPSDFTKEIQRVVPSSPRLTNNDPICGADGLYCIDGPDPAAWVIAGDSWSKAVEQIYQTQSFKTCVPALFFTEIMSNGKKPGAGEDGLELHANTNYHLTVHYKYPQQRGDGRRRRIYIKMGNEINREFSVGSASDRLTVPFNLPVLDFSTGAIAIETIVEGKDSTWDEIRYTAPISFRTSIWRTNVLLFGLLFLVSFLDEFWQAEWDFLNTHAWISTFFQFFKFTLVIWAIFSYRGKLKLPGL